MSRSSRRILIYIHNNALVTIIITQVNIMHNAPPQPPDPISPIHTHTHHHYTYYDHRHVYIPYMTIVTVHRTSRSRSSSHCSRSSKANGTWGIRRTWLCSILCTGARGCGEWWGSSEGDRIVGSWCSDRNGELCSYRITVGNVNLLLQRSSLK